MNRVYWKFPYDQVNPGEKIILAGAGAVGQSFAKEIREKNYCQIVAISDLTKTVIDGIDNIEVISHDEIENFEYNKIVISAEIENGISIWNSLKHLNIDNKKIIFDTYRVEYEPTIEAEVVYEVFKKLGIDSPSYIDLGACHPVIFSNTELLYLKGGKGINIEADIDQKKYFDLYRKEDINLFVGCAATSGDMELYVSENPYLTTFSLNAAKWAEDIYNANYTSKRVIETKTLNEIVDQYADGIFPDFLDCDIEGLDCEVLRQVDFSKSSPKVICVEARPEIMNEILINKECEQGGYIPYCVYEANTIYLRKDIWGEVLKVGLDRLE